MPTTPLTLTLKGTSDSAKLATDRSGAANVNLLDYSRYYPRLDPFVFQVSSPTGEWLAEFPVNAGAVIPFVLSDVDQDVPETGANLPDAVAVVIGVAEYQKPGVPPVEFALRDAETIKTYLTKVLGFRPENIIYLANPSKADLERVFGTPDDYRGELYNFVKSGVSDVFVYYSGHGAPDVDSRTGYFVPADCSPDYVRLNGYALRTFYENLTHVPSKNMTVVIDACFSGQYDNGVLAEAASGITIVPRLSVLPSNINVFTSCDTNQVASWYSDKRHGLFTYYFLKALKQAATPTLARSLTLGELNTFVSDSVSYIARRLRGRSQTPTFSGDPTSPILRPK